MKIKHGSCTCRRKNGSLQKKIRRSRIKKVQMKQKNRSRILQKKKFQLVTRTRIIWAYQGSDELIKDLLVYCGPTGATSQDSLCHSRAHIQFSLRPSTYWGSLDQRVLIQAQQTILSRDYRRLLWLSLQGLLVSTNDGLLQLIE